MLKLLILTRYERSGASSRMRFYQYLPGLEAAGFEVTISPLFSDDYVAELQKGRKSFSKAFFAYPKRLKVLLKAQRFDIVWIEKEALPWIPAMVEQFLLPNNVPYILDYDDAVFHYYDLHKNLAVRKFLGTKHQSLIKGASLILAGNQYLANFAKSAGAKAVEIIPTVIDLERYPKNLLKDNPIDSTRVPCIGWIGQRSTAYFLSPYKDLFQRLGSSGIARFAAIGIDTLSLDLPMESVVWSEQTEVTSIAKFDVGIMPLVDQPFERGKCGYKLIQYMACGLPVIASPVGVNCQIVEHGVDGFLAENLEQWENSFLKLAKSEELRKQMGRKGREKIEQYYSIQVTGPKLARLLQKVAKKENF
ncbi:MAG: glycosyltransferase family 4 protein [Pseudomonadota bacterium]